MSGRRYTDCLERISDGARVLDVGCGTGEFTAQIAGQTPAGFVLGIDTWTQAIQQASQTYPRENFRNLAFEVADVGRLQLKTRSFDYVVSRACLHHLSHPGHGFAGICRYLRTGGEMHVWFLGKGNAVLVNKALNKATNMAEWKPYFQGYRPGWSLVSLISCEPWLKAARFRKNYSEVVEEELVFPDRWSFVYWVASNWRNYFERVPNSSVPKFCEDFLSHCQPTAEGSYRVTLVWLVIDAVRV